VFAFELENGPVPEGKMVCHSCDNPPCCNGKHLFAGTNDENVADKMVKGRNARGAMMSNAKLNAAQVLQIRQRYAPGTEGQRGLAKAFGVSKTLVALIVKGASWSHLPS